MAAISALSTERLVDHATCDRELEAIERVLARDGSAVEVLDVLTRELGEHFAKEERELLPLYEGAEPQDAALIRGQHASLLGLLATMHARAEARTFDHAAYRTLRMAIHSHHAHEELGLYRWLQAANMR